MAYSETGSWDNLQRRLQSVAEQQASRGLVVVTVRVVLVRGELRVWSTPTVEPWEPAGAGEEFLRDLSVR